MKSFDHPDDALVAIVARFTVVGVDSVDTMAVGRVLAAQIVADRDSPAADVSAMDGYAVRATDIAAGSANVAGECAAGDARKKLPHGGVLKIFTGAVVPEGCEIVVKREDTRQSGDVVHFDLDAVPATGTHIRRRGENLRGGQLVLPAGTLLTPATVAAAINFGGVDTVVHRRVRVTVITTGGEVLAADQTPAEHQLRNSNAAAVTAVLGNHPWLDMAPPQHCDDDPTTLSKTIAAAIEDSDAVLLTGGVSMGDHDYVPQCVRANGGEIIFHRLPIRPGKPILGAVTANGKLICGLPGNPVSAVVNTRRMALPMLRAMAGIQAWMPTPPMIALATPIDTPIGLQCMRLITIDGDGRASEVSSRGSGDLVSLAHSDGFVEVPANQTGPGPYRFWAW